MRSNVAVWLVVKVTESPHMLGQTEEALGVLTSEKEASEYALREAERFVTDMKSEFDKIGWTLEVVGYDGESLGLSPVKGGEYKVWAEDQKGYGQVAAVFAIRAVDFFGKGE